MPSLLPLRGVRMEDDLYLKLRHIAKENNRSYNQEAVYVLRQYVERYEREHGVIPVDTDDLYK